MALTKYKKIMLITKCPEQEARSASRALSLLGEFKGSVLTFSPSVQDYLMDECAKCIEDVLTNPSDVDRGEGNAEKKAGRAVREDK